MNTKTGETYGCLLQSIIREYEFKLARGDWFPELFEPLLAILEKVTAGPTACSALPRMQANSRFHIIHELVSIIEKWHHLQPPVRRSPPLRLSRPSDRRMEENDEARSAYRLHHERNFGHFHERERTVDSSIHSNCWARLPYGKELQNLPSPGEQFAYSDDHAVSIFS